MSDSEKSFNRVREYRERFAWSQAELAARAEISRAAVSAIEIGRLVPSVEAALALARVFNISVEELFAPARSSGTLVEWAWKPHSPQQRCWLAEIEGTLRAYPVEDGPTSFWPHDHLGLPPHPDTILYDLARRTLVVATCDPAAGLLAQMAWNLTGIRLIAVNRSSRQSLALLRDGLVHAAGVHLASSDEPDENRRVASEIIQSPLTSLRIGTWQSGVAVGGATPPRSIRGLQRENLTWIGRTVGSGAYQSQQEVLGEKSPRRTARDHRGVIEAIRNGWGEAGITLRWVAEEAGLSFLSVRNDLYDWFFPPDFIHDPRLQGMLRLLRSGEYQQAAPQLPGNTCESAGELD